MAWCQIGAMSFLKQMLINDVLEHKKQISVEYFVEFCGTFSLTKIQLKSMCILGCKNSADVYELTILSITMDDVCYVPELGWFWDDAASIDPEPSQFWPSVKSHGWCLSRAMRSRRRSRGRLHLVLINLLLLES